MFDINTIKKSFRKVSGNISYLFLLFTFFLSGCGNPNPSHEYAIIKQAENIMKEFPDSALVLLGNISLNELTNKEERAEYILLLNQLKDDKKIIIYQQDSLLTESVNYYTKKKDYLNAARAYYLRSKALYNSDRHKGDIEKSLSDCLQAKEYAEQIKDNKLYGQIYHTIGRLYFAQNNYQEALKNYKKAASYFSLDNLKREEAAILVRTGGIYELMQQPDSSIVYYTKALTDFLPFANHTSESDMIFLSGIYKNIGVYYQKIENHESANREFLKAYELLPKKEGANANILFYLMSQSHASLNRPDSAIYYNKLYTEVPNESLIEKLHRTYNSYKLYKLLNNDEQALKYHEDATLLMDSLYTENLSKSISEIELKYDKQLLENQYNEVLIQRLYLAVTVVIILLLAIIFAWIFRNRIKKREKELTEAQQSLDTFRQLLSEQDKKLRNFNEVISERDEKSQHLRDFLINQLDISRKVAQMNVVMTDDTKEFMKQFQRIFQKDMLDWENIYPHINELYNGFVDKIKEAYPNLTEKELQLCCLIRAGFRSDEQAVILHYTQNSIRVKRTQLVKKMGFENAEAFLENLIQI